MLIQIDASEQLAREADSRHRRLLEQAPELAVAAGLRASARARFAASLEALEQKPLPIRAAPDAQLTDAEPTPVQLPKDEKVTVW